MKISGANLQMVSNTMYAYKFSETSMPPFPTTCVDNIMAIDGDTQRDGRAESNISLPQTSFAGNTIKKQQQSKYLL